MPPACTILNRRYFVDAEKLTTELFEKMETEQDRFKAHLLTQAPADILLHAYEYTVREGILMALDSIELTEDQVSALLASYTPLADIYKDWCNQETGYMDNIRDTIEGRADELVQQEEELLKSPVYKYPFEYARDNDELQQYHTSCRANAACKKGIEAAISKYHIGYSFNSKAAVRDVAKKFGYERTLFVLAATVQNHEHDGRYSRSNKDWARTAPVYDTERSLQYAVISHPVLVDAFLATARHEHLRSLPLTKEDIKAEALNILCKFQDAREPNSPNGTHYIAEISPDFLLRAKTKDTDRLMAMLPFQSLSFSTLEGRRGTYALISRDENRFQKLVLRKLSVRKKLQEQSTAVKPPKKSAAKDQER